VDIVIKTILIISKDRQITQSNYKNKKLKFFLKKCLRMSFHHAFSKSISMNIIKKKIKIQANVKKLLKFSPYKKTTKKQIKKNCTFSNEIQKIKNKSKQIQYIDSWFSQIFNIKSFIKLRSF
jgi:hypothetical protein